MVEHFEFSLFFGDAADAAARVYALATRAKSARQFDELQFRDLQISGRIEGPRCRYSHTLPATVPLEFRGTKCIAGRQWLVGEAVVPDPCFWTPDLPFLYRAVVEVRVGPQVAANYEQAFGIRPLGVVDKRIVFRGKTWVPRILRRAAVAGTPTLEEWREAAAVMAVDDPTDSLCSEASATGVALLALLNGNAAAFARRAAELSRYPAVVFIAAHDGATFDDVLRTQCRNVLFAAMPTDVDAGRADVVLANVDAATETGVAAAVRFGKPIIAVDHLATPVSLTEARAACDDLQRRIAGKSQAAGYFV